MQGQNLRFFMIELIFSFRCLLQDHKKKAYLAKNEHIKRTKDNQESYFVSGFVGWNF